MSTQSHRAAPDRHQLPAVQKLRVRFAKRGRLRFTSHRDFQRAFERALRRAKVPMAYSHGFTPHPKVSFVGAAPTGAASEAEYLEISLTERRDPAQVRADLDAALPPGLDVLEVSDTEGQKTALADLLRASSWEIALDEASGAEVAAAVTAFMAEESVPVERLTKKGVRTLEARGAVLDAAVHVAASSPGQADQPSTVVIRCVVEHQAPTVRPEEILAGLRVATGFTPVSPPRNKRLAQGVWDAQRREVVAP
ncbi:TIGR03936 family radical SAM-associated protein [Phytoactinopolyspora alkaliphila]|uniref:TIGR03936 family radical SAM-associated protein n=1 Tax=Phytoactinopolyspora alkaliphila TaxID=1783498 RepID=UPI001C20999E